MEFATIVEKSVLREEGSNMGGLRLSKMEGGTRSVS